MTTCSNCGTPQGPFNKQLIQGKALCVAKNLEACGKRRAKLDRDQWEIYRKVDRH